ncbi:MAG: GNAT family N-acetyltransferase [bacterium]|nr:GNAT family N-acetyltransferase [bacterium]
MIQYRLATIDDVEGIQHVLSTTWLSTYSNLKPETIEQVKARWHSTEFLSKQINNEKFYFPIAVDSEEVVGIATSGTREEEAVDLFRFYVLPEHQGKGIGSKLFVMVEDRYPDAKKVRAYVDVNNQQGIEYYERQGFKKIKQETEESFGEVMIEWLMEMEL